MVSEQQTSPPTMADRLRMARKSEDRVMRESPFGSWLLGSGDQDGGKLRIRVRWLLGGLLAIANIVGATVAILLVTLVMPGPPVFTDELVLVNFVAVPAYIVVSWACINIWAVIRGLRVLHWATDGGQLDEHQRRATLRLPAEFTIMQALAWLGGLIVFSLLYGLANPDLLLKIAFSIVLSGTVTCANAYLLSEFALRPIAARALSTGPRLRRLSVGVTLRTLLFWAMGTAVPVLGLMLVALLALLRVEDVSRFDFAVTVLVLGAITLAGGFGVTLLTTRATTAPIRTVRAALARVERGDFDTEVVVFDGTELGRLQTGFNDMVAGLRERERVKDIFGRLVGEDVAEVAMSQQVELGGELRDVAVLFVDVVGSTAIAATRPPTEVVELLNRFFAVVVDEVHAHDGFVNKFQGDAALAIFGAPTELPDAECMALKAARRMNERLRAEVPEFPAGIGVSAGPAVAGNVGAETRFEYTVIGDPVNEAARLTELAKSVRGNVAASMRVLERACDDDERKHWREYKRVPLRGRTEHTRVAVLADGGRRR
ncbi:adenylate/guanylate cyclase domain-containing protein [Haloechinothrix salitolerans]